MSVSLGSELPDAFDPVNAWVDTNISFLADIEHFYREKASIEREYAEKLNKLTAEHLSKTATHAPALAVGTSPAVTPGSLDSASVVAWKESLIQSQRIAQTHSKLANKLDKNVATGVATLRNKYSAIVQKWQSTHSHFIESRDTHFAEVNRRKRNYDSTCQSMEAQRSKRQSDKFAKREAEMQIAKNDYLIAIAVANRLKDKFYYQDLPEIIDGLQNLHELKVSKLNTIWLSTSIIERDSLTEIINSYNSIDTVVEQNLPKLDTLMFLKHNARNWSEPVDFKYLPSPIWHDDDHMVVNEASLLFLKVMLNNSSQTYESIQSKCNDTKQTVEELSSKRSSLIGDSIENVVILSPDTYTEAEDTIQKFITALQKFVDNDTTRVISEVQIETIQAVTHGIDMSYEATNEKKSRFAVFKKATDKVIGSGSGANVVITTTNTKSRLFDKINKFAESYNTPLAAGATTSSSSASAHAIALYPYSATGDDETNISKGEKVVVLESDDGGWTFVKSSTGEGLVPTSYLKVVTASSVPPPPGPPRKVGVSSKKFRVLYEYVAAGDDEVSVSKGDVLKLVKDDDDGWTLVEKNGAVGLVPTSYGLVE